MAGGISRGVIWVVLAAIALVASPRPARACAPAPHAGESVRIFEEEALIVWDAKTKTQHFIRRAAFDTQAKDFGFLVPTPEKPELAEADDSVFFRLAQAIAPVPGVSRSGITITAALLLGMNRQAAARFSFLLSIPVIAGAGTLKLWQLVNENTSVDWAVLAVGALVSGVVAYLCIALFLRLLDRVGLMPFVYYRVLLAAVLYGLWLA